jgi:hypothetical protein
MVDKQHWFAVSFSISLKQKKIYTIDFFLKIIKTKLLLVFEASFP